MSSDNEAIALARSRNTSIAILALLALLIAQAAAGLHALKHFHVGAEQASPPGLHLQLCLECASFASLSAAHGGPATSLVVAVLAGDDPQPHSRPAQSGERFPAPFQARAPPR